jgi:hypothetical protein
LTPFEVATFAFLAVCPTLTHLSNFPDLVHLYFTLFVICVAPTFAHLPPEVAASAGALATNTAPTSKSVARRAMRLISVTILPVNKHPWNTSFEWQNHQAISRVLTQTQIDQFDQDGYVVVNEDDPTGSHPIAIEPRGLPVLQNGQICAD